MIVALNLSPAFDRTLVVDSLRVGAVNRPAAVYVTAGGKGANVARVATALGADVTLVTALGDGDSRYRAMLDSDGIAHLAVAAPAAIRTCTTIVDTASGDVTDLYEPAAPLDERTWSELLDGVERLLGASPPGGWLVLSGSMPNGVPAGGIARLAALARGAGQGWAVDTSGPALAEALPLHPDVVKVNVAEASALVGEASPAELAARLERDARLAVVTAGVEGAVARGVRVCSDTHGAHPVGSGDAFLAGLLAALPAGVPAGGAELHAALRLATGAGAANALVPGAGRLDAATARQLAAAATLSPSDR